MKVYCSFTSSPPAYVSQREIFIGIQKSRTTELETMQLKFDHAKFALLKKCEHWADKSNKGFLVPFNCIHVMLDFS